MTHYDVLGVASTASADELREAYRRAARAAHPDRHGAPSGARMAAVNEAWRVLRDPVRRRAYDMTIDTTIDAAAGAAPARVSDPTAAEPVPVFEVLHEPARFPWRFMAGLAGAGVALVLVATYFTEPAPEPAPDGLLGPGACVDLAVDLTASEVLCGGEHDAVVEALVPFGSQCPSGTEGYRDRQGMGTACVVRVGA